MSLLRLDKGPVWLTPASNDAPYQGKCYIAGPMTGYPSFNYASFDGARDRLVAEGWDVVSPADLDRQNLGIDFSKMTGKEDLAEYITRFARQDVHSLLVVNAVFLLPGWKESNGASNEARIAKMLGVDLIDFETREPVLVKATFSGAVKK